MPTVKSAGASAHQPMSQPGRGRTGRLAQATRATSHGAAQANSAKASLSNRKAR